MSNTWIVIILAIVVVLAAMIFLFAKKIRNKQQHQLYIGNLSYYVQESELKKFFSQYGNVESIHIVKNKKTRRSKGFGFVTYVSGRDAKEALQAHGQLLKGRALIVRMAKPPTK